MFLRDPMILNPNGRRQPWTAWTYAHRSQETLWRMWAPVSRRVTPRTRVDGELIVQIPSPDVADIVVDMDEATAAAYAGRLDLLRRELSRTSSGLAATRAMYSLRLILSGGTPLAVHREDTTLRFTDYVPPVTEDTVQTYGDTATCPVCFEPPCEPASTPCGHTFCCECLTQWFGSRTTATCPCCRQQVDESSVVVTRLPRDDDGDGDGNTSDDATVTGAAKADAFRDVLAGLGDAKMLVFTQFADTITRLADICSNADVPYMAMHSGMTATARGRAIREFNEHGGPAVFLLTVQASSCGINLTSATRVLFYEPVLNDSAEIQAIARAVRIGQTERVRVQRFLTRGTIEPAIIRMRNARRFDRDMIMELIGAARE